MKLIGIVGRVYYNRDNQEIVQVNDYLRMVLSSYDDIIPIVLLPTKNDNYIGMGMGNDEIDKVDKMKLDYILGMCDAFIVPGGTYWYKFDEYVIKYAIDSNKPLLGICAGFQAICSMFSVNRDKFDMTCKLLNNKHYGDKVEYKHGVFVMGDTLLSKILKKNKIMVNSIHHDYVAMPVSDLIVSGISEDNIIEAVELRDNKFFLAVQWHPEYLIDDYSKRIFDAFIDSIK